MLEKNQEGFLPGLLSDIIGDPGVALRPFVIACMALQHLLL